MRTSWRPCRGWGSRIFPIVLAGFAAFLDLYATQPLLPMLMDAFGASRLAVSLTIAAPTVAVAIAAPIAGRWADLAGRKRLIVGSAFVIAAATALAATARTLPQFIAWRLLQGLMTPGIFASAVAYIHDEWPGSHSGRATAAYVAGTVLGGFTGRALVGVVAAEAGWQAAFLALAVVNVAAALALSIWLPRERHHDRSLSGGHHRSVLRLIRNRQLVATNAAGFCVLFSQVAIFSYVTFHLSAAPYALNTAQLGWLFAVYLVGAAAVSGAGGWIDRHGHRAGLLGGVAVGCVGALLTLMPSLTAIVVGLALVGTGVFIAQAAASSYIGAVTAEDRGLAVGLYSSCYYLGGSTGGSAPALLWARGGWPACVVLVVAVQAVTASLALAFWRTGVTHHDVLAEAPS